MKLLLINDHISLVGGGDTVLNLERAFFQKIGWDVQTIGFSDKQSEFSDFKTIEESPHHVKRKIDKFVRGNYEHTITEYIKDFCPDLIHIHLNSKYPLSVLRATKKSQIQIFYTVHGPNFLCASSWGGLKSGAPCELGISTKCFSRGCVKLHEYALHKILSTMVNDLHSGIHTFLAPSKWIMSHLHRLGLQNVRHLPLAVEDMFFENKPMPSFTTVNLLYVGAVIEQKGVHLLPKILYELNHKGNRSFQLIIAGKGKLKDTLEKEFKNLNIEGYVTWLGHVVREDIMKVYDAAQVLIMPSIWQEQFGLVGVEASARGIPAVASNVGGISEWLSDGFNGELATPNCVQSFVDGVNKILHDYSRYSSNATNSSQRFSSYAYCNGLKNIFEGR